MAQAESSLASIEQAYDKLSAACEAGPSHYLKSIDEDRIVAFACCRGQLPGVERMLTLAL